MEKCESMLCVVPVDGFGRTFQPSASDRKECSNLTQAMLRSCSDHVGLQETPPHRDLHVNTSQGNDYNLTKTPAAGEQHDEGSCNINE
jgi:hypothetical protein